MGRNPLPIIIIVAAAVILIGLSQQPKAATKPDKPTATTPHPAAPQKPDVIVLVEFGNHNCILCSQQHPLVEQLESEGQQVRHVTTGQGNSAEDKAEIRKRGVVRWPVYIAERNGKELRRIEGAATIEDLRALVADPVAKVKVTPRRKVDESPKPVPAKPVFGENGWRMRLFFPPDSEAGKRINCQFTEDEKLKAFAKEYGYEAITTDSERFDEWRGLGYLRVQITLVLVNPDGDVVYHEHRVLKDPGALLDELREAVESHGSMGFMDWQPTSGWRRVR